MLFSISKSLESSMCVHSRSLRVSTNISIKYEDRSILNENLRFELCKSKTFWVTRFRIPAAHQWCTFETQNSMLPCHPCAFVFIIDRSKLRLGVWHVFCTYPQQHSREEYSGRWPTSLKLLLLLLLLLLHVSHLENRSIWNAMVFKLWVVLL